MRRQTRAAGVWVRLARAYAATLRRVREHPLPGNLTLPQFDVMSQLLRFPAGITSAELSDSLLVTAGNVTGIVQRLKARGLLSRTVDPRDRRVRVLRLTAAGRRLAERAVEEQELHLANILSNLKDSQQDQLCHLLDSMRQALRPEP